MGTIGVDEVCTLLGKNGLGMYASVFKEFGIDGQGFAALDSSTCEKLRVLQLHRPKLLRVAAKFKEEPLSLETDSKAQPVIEIGGSAQEARDPAFVEVLKKLVLRENELRVSHEWQERFAAAERRADTDWLECVAELQLQVVREFGLQDDTVNLLRRASQLYPSEPFFQEVPLYVRYNRARNGEMGEGEDVPDVEVLNLSGERMSLWELGGDAEPLVLIGGSHS